MGGHTTEGVAFQHLYRRKGDAMRRILVVAHKTLGGDRLRDEVRRRIEEGGCSFHLVVPEDHSVSGSWSEGQVHAAAERVLDEGLADFRALDPTGSADFTGEVGDEIG